MKLKLLEVPKKHGEILFFWFEEQVQAKQAFLQRSEYSSVHSLCFVLGMLQDLLWRWFLGFSVSPSGIWSLGDAEDSGEDRRLQGGCAQLPRGIFGSLSFGSRGSQTWKMDWKWWDHKQRSDLTSQHGESLDSINNQGWFWGNSGFDHGLYYRGFLEVNWLTAGEIPCRTEESKRGSVFMILQGWWDKLAQGELLWQMLLHHLPRLPKYGRLTKIFSTSFALPWARFVSQNRSNSEVRMQWLATMTRAWFSALSTLAWGDAQQEWIPATKHWKMLMTKDHTLMLTIDSSLLWGSICVWILQPLSIHIRQDDLDIGHQSPSWLIENELARDHMIPKEMVQIHRHSSRFFFRLCIDQRVLSENGTEQFNVAQLHIWHCSHVQSTRHTWSLGA